MIPHRSPSAIVKGDVLEEFGGAEGDSDAGAGKQGYAEMEEDEEDASERKPPER